MMGAAPPPDPTAAGPPPKKPKQPWQVPGAAQNFVNQYAPEETRPYILRPRRFMKNAITGEGGPGSRLARLRAASNYAGYGQPERTLNAGITKEFNDPTSYASTPMVGQLANYVSSRLGVGLTPGEASAYSGQQREAVEGATAESARQAGTRLASSGIDPRSGLGASQFGQISRARESGLADVARNVTLLDLARKQQIEQEASGVAGQEIGRRGDVENAMQNAARLEEEQREADLGFTQGLTEAQLQREALKRAAKLGEPSTLEQVGGIFHGLSQGLQGGGGGGGSTGI